MPKGTGDAHTRSLAGKGPADWVAALSDPNMFWRTTAQRLLVERGDVSVMPALLRLVDDRSLDPIGLNAPAIHALWTMHGLGAFLRRDSTAMSAGRRALTHPSAGVRRTAIQVLPQTTTLLADMQRSGILADPDLRVRLAALVAMAGMPSSSAVSTAIKAMMADDANLRDEWVRQALLAAGRIHRSGLSAALSAPAPHSRHAGGPMEEGTPRRHPGRL